MRERVYYEITGEDIKELGQICDVMAGLGDGGVVDLALAQSVELKLKNILFYSKARKRVSMKLDASKCEVDI